MAKPDGESVGDGPQIDIKVTDRSDEWSPDSPGLLMPTQSVCDTPEADLDHPPTKPVPATP